MAKKILAVVLAVMMAVSAMAISVAADNPTIPLYRTTTSHDSTFGVELTIPVFTQYGWGTQYDGMEIELPNNLGNGLATEIYRYYVIVNGQQFYLKPSYPVGVVDAGKESEKEYKLPDGVDEATAATHNAAPSWSNSDASTYKQYIYFGAFVHDYFVDGNGVEHFATVPQTQTFGATTSIKIGIEFDGGQWDSTWKLGSGFTYNNKYGHTVSLQGAAPADILSHIYPTCVAQFLTYDSESETYLPVKNSETYMTYWNPVKTGGENEDVTSTKQEFASGDLATVVTSGDANNNGVLDWLETGYITSTKNVAAYPLTWDHNLANRATILGAEGDYAELVVELDKPLNGVATYTLYARAYDNGQYNNGYVNVAQDDPLALWWNYTGNRELVDSVSIDGEQSELRFKVPLDLLYDASGYGNYNSEFVIFETIGLYNSTFMADEHTIVSSVPNTGDAGFITWNKSSKSDPVTDLAWVNYKGKPVNYAAGGTAFPNKTLSDGRANPNYYSAVFAEKIYLEFPTTEDSEPANDDEVKTPTEAADGANDPDSGDDMSAGETDNTPAEKNPETGIALAIVPMLVAAAAAVVSKKH